MRPTNDIVDVLVADHAPPSVVEPLLGREMVRIEGGTQALRHTIEARLEIESRPVGISVPRPFAAVILKAAAFRTDDHVAWLALPDQARRDGRAALRVLCRP